MITIYTKTNCPHCDTAKAFLAKYNIATTEVNIVSDPDALHFLRSRGHRSVPQIYNDGILIEGGSAGLQKLTEEKLRQLVTKATTITKNNLVWEESLEIGYEELAPILSYE